MSREVNNTNGKSCSVCDCRLVFPGDPNTGKIFTMYGEVLTPNCNCEYATIEVVVCDVCDINDVLSEYNP